MLKDYLKENSISIYALSKSSGVAYSTLNDLANAKVEIDNCKVGILRNLAQALKVSLQEVYDICAEQKRIHVDTQWNVPADVSVRNKTYYVSFVYNGAPVELELCKVNKETSYYIRQIATWRTESYIREQRMNDPWNIF